MICNLEINSKVLSPPPSLPLRNIEHVNTECFLIKAYHLTYFLPSVDKSNIPQCKIINIRFNFNHSSWAHLAFLLHDICQHSSENPLGIPGLSLTSIFRSYRECERERQLNRMFVNHRDLGRVFGLYIKNHWKIYTASPSLTDPLAEWRYEVEAVYISMLHNSYR